LSGAGVATFVNKSFPVIRQWHRNQHVDRRGFRIADGRSVRSHDRSLGACARRGNPRPQRLAAQPAV